MKPLERKLLMLKGKLKRTTKMYEYLQKDFQVTDTARQKAMAALAKSRTEVINLKRTIKRGGPLGPAPVQFDPKYIPSYEAACKHFKDLIIAYKDGADICIYLNPDPNEPKTIDSPIVKWKIIKDGDDFLDAEFCGEFTIATLPVD